MFHSTTHWWHVRNVIESATDWQVYLVIVLVSAIVYGKSITYEFTYVDDLELVVLNQNELSSLANVPKLFQSDVFLSTTNAKLFYRPLLNILFMFETFIAKDSPTMYHITNILLHIGCSILTYKVLRQLGCVIQVAGIAALLFCVHPLNASAVVWIPGCNDTLLTVLILGSFSFLLRAMNTKRAGPLVWHAILFFLALLTKESAIVFPILTVSYVFFFYDGTSRKTVSMLAFCTYILPIVVWFVLRSSVPQTFTVHLKTDFFLMSSLRNVPGLFLYVGKIFLPFNLSIFPNLTDNSIVPGILCSVALLAVWMAWKFPSTKEVVWGFGWFLLFLIPTFVSNFILFEHRAYSAFFGLLFCTTQLPFLRSLNLSKTIHVLGIVVVLAGFAIIAMFHSEQYRNRTSYVMSAYTSNPSIDGSYANLAELFIAEGNYDDAERVLRKGIARDPDMVASHRILADILARRHEYEMAAQEYETSLRLNPLQLNTYITYGTMCLELGRVDKASRLWKASVKVNPNYIFGYYHLANFYIHVKNDPDSAMFYARQIQEHGATVMPELLREIQANPLYGGRKP